MSAVSANATALPDRRHFLSTIAGVGALGLPAMPVMAGTHGMPGPIEAMFPEHLRLEAGMDALSAPLGDAEARYEEPEQPRWHPVLEEGGFKTIPTTPGRGRCVLDDGEENLAYLRETIAREHEPDDPDVGTPNALRARKARKTLAKIEAWQAEVRCRKDAAGLTEAEAAYRAAGDKADACREAILVIEATTFRELAFQAAILDVDWDQVAAERLLGRLTALAGVVPYVPA